MKKKKKKLLAPDRTDPRLAAGIPTANSAEFVPVADPGFPAVNTDETEDGYDFIPELKGNKFS